MPSKRTRLSRRAIPAQMLSAVAHAWIRDQPIPEGADGPHDFESFRLDLDLIQMEHADNRALAVWLRGGPAVIEEIGVEAAKELPCWRAFGDPRRPRSRDQ